MDLKSKILGGLLIGAVIVSVGVTYYKTVIQHDFEATDPGPEDIEE